MYNTTTFCSFLALKIHCSPACKDLLDGLQGYELLERGVVDLKGKGEVLTYWLVGEELEHQVKRTEERDKRRSELNNKPSVKKGTKTQQENGSLGAPRSSLKTRTLTPSPRNHLSRCASLESPKKLRFAANHTLEFTNPYQKCSKDPLLEVIADNSPSKRNETESFCVNHLSASCPCIENFSPVTCKPPHLPLLESASNSEPMLSASAPVSPNDSCSQESPLLMAVMGATGDEADAPLLRLHDTGGFGVRTH